MLIPVFENKDLVKEKAIISQFCSWVRYVVVTMGIRALAFVTFIRVLISTGREITTACKKQNCSLLFHTRPRG